MKVHVSVGHLLMSPFYPSVPFSSRAKRVSKQLEYSVNAGLNLLKLACVFVVEGGCFCLQTFTNMTKLCAQISISSFDMVVCSKLWL